MTTATGGTTTGGTTTVSTTTATDGTTTGGTTTAMGSSTSAWTLGLLCYTIDNNCVLRKYC
jgi:hypothetical protein